MTTMMACSPFVPLVWVAEATEIRPLAINGEVFTNPLGKVLLGKLDTEFKLTRSHGIHLDVVPGPVKLLLLSRQMVVALFSPKAASRECQRHPGPLCRDAFQRFCQFGQWDGGSRVEVI